MHGKFDDMEISTILTHDGNYNIAFLQIVGHISAASLENLFMPYANTKGTDQPAHPRSLISAFVVRCLNSIIYINVISKISSLASEAEQTGLCLT